MSEHILAWLARPASDAHVYGLPTPPMWTVWVPCHRDRGVLICKAYLQGLCAGEWPRRNFGQTLANIPRCLGHHVRGESPLPSRVHRGVIRAEEGRTRPKIGRYTREGRRRQAPARNKGCVALICDGVAISA